MQTWADCVADCSFDGPPTLLPDEPRLPGNQSGCNLGMFFFFLVCVAKSLVLVKKFPESGVFLGHCVHHGDAQALKRSAQRFGSIS